MSVPTYGARVYYEKKDIYPAVVTFNGDNYTSSWQYNGPAKAYTSGGASYTNVYVLTENNRLIHEKLVSWSSSSRDFAIRGETNVTAGTTYTNFGIIVGYLDWIVNDGIRAVTATSTIPGNMTGITIGFASNQWATEIYATIRFCNPATPGTTAASVFKTYTNSTKLFSANFMEDSSVLAQYALGRVVKEVQLYFRMWSTTGIPVVTFVAPYLVKDYIKTNGLISYIRGSQSSTDNKYPKYGIVSGYGEIKLRDLNNSIQNYIRYGVFKKRFKVKLFLDNTFIGGYVTDDVKYDEGNKELFVSLTDDLLDLQGKNWVANKIINQYTANYVYSNFIRGTTIGENVLLDPLYYDVTRSNNAVTRLGYISFGDFFFKDDTYFNTINKFLDAAGLVLFKTPFETSEINTYYILRQQVLISTLDSNTSTDIIIPPQRLLQAPIKNVINRNYIEGVTYERQLLVPKDYRDSVAESQVFQENKLNHFTFKTSEQVLPSTDVENNFTWLTSLFSWAVGVRDYEGLATTLNFGEIGYGYTSPPWTAYAEITSGSGTGFYTYLFPSNVAHGAWDVVIKIENAYIKATDFNNITADVYWNQYVMNRTDGYFKPASRLGPYTRNGTITSITRNPTAGTITINWGNSGGGASLGYNSPMTVYVSSAGTYPSYTPDDPVNTIRYTESVVFRLKGISYELTNLDPKLVGSSINTFELPTNELTIESSIFTNSGTQTLADWHANFLINGYSNGRETLELTCMYGSYLNSSSGTYSTGNDGVIFYPSRKVKPQVYRNGVLEAVSKTDSGADKLFIITSAEFINDGNPRIELKLIEEGAVA